jgi:serine/threonine-protein kinase
VTPPPTFLRLRQLFDRLSELPEGEREAEIARLAEGDAALAGELREMLALMGETRTPLDGAAILMPAGDPTRDVAPEVPGFRVERRIGRGGSATVYLAEQAKADFKRHVALKVVDRIIDADSLRRVSEEQRILARLEHPGIARLYDAGVTSVGQPFLAMEHVAGRSIVEHCRERSLSIAERLNLFLEVLDAVAYAHGEAVVHRDLKPANILVSDEGRAKLLDFGIAKLVAGPGEDEETRTLRRAMTPAYASPEQVRGDRLTASSDIYSLGVVLYELLAETLPYRLDSKPYETLEDAIRDQDPEPPSSAYARTAGPATGAGTDRGNFVRRRRALRGDLDAILLKTLRKEPGARYTSVADLAADLRRVLDGRPVEARRANRRYLAARFVKRRWRIVLAVALAVPPGLAVAVPSWRQRWVVPLLSVAPGARELSIFRHLDLEKGVRTALESGADRLQAFDALAARDAFLGAQKLAAGEPTAEAVAWDGLSRSFSLMGEVGAAADAAKRAAALPFRLRAPEDQRLAARSRAFDDDQPATSRVAELEALFLAEPERADLGLDLAVALGRVGKTEAALSILERVGQLSVSSAATARDPRLDLTEADLAYRFGEFQRSAAAAERARTRAVELGSKPLAIRARRHFAEASLRLDRRDEAMAQLDEVARDASALGMPREAGAARGALGWIQARVASNEVSRATLEQALVDIRRAGDARLEALAESDLALLSAKEGAFDMAIARSARALAQSRRIADRWIEAKVLTDRFVILSWGGADQKTVDEAVEQGLAALRESGNRQPLITVLANLAILSTEAADLAAAENYVSEAEALSRKLGSSAASAQVDGARSYLEEIRGNLDLARQSLERGLEKARQSKTGLLVANLLQNRAQLEMTAEQPAAAAEWARQAVEAYAAAGDQHNSLETQALLVWASAASASRAEALQERARWREDVSREEGASGSLPIVVLEARIAEALGESREAIVLRRRALTLATEQAQPLIVLEQRFWIARLLAQSGQRRELDRVLPALLRDLEARGVRRMADELRSLTTAPERSSQR